MLSLSKCAKVDLGTSIVIAVTQFGYAIDYIEQVPVILLAAAHGEHAFSPWQSISVARSDVARGR